jgi:hypothetical protein
MTAALSPYDIWKDFHPDAETASPKQLTKQQQEFEAHIQKWKKYYEEKRGKISNEFPKTIFDKHEE